MSNSVEVRMPFLDNNVRLFGLALSGSNKMKNGFTKSARNLAESNKVILTSDSELENLENLVLLNA